MSILDSLQNWARSYAGRDDESDARSDVKPPGCRDIDAVNGRCRAEVSGVIRSVMRSVPGECPRLSVTVSDGTGVVEALWLGRREISGIEPGVRVRLEGRFAPQSGRYVTTNPAYTLMPDRVPRA